MPSDKKHNWKLAWPGNWCLDCGLDDPWEYCVATNPDCQCMPGPDGEPKGECTVDVPPCPAAVWETQE